MLYDDVLDMSAPGHAPSSKAARKLYKTIKYLLSEDAANYRWLVKAIAALAACDVWQPVCFYGGISVHIMGRDLLSDPWRFEAAMDCLTFYHQIHHYSLWDFTVAQEQPCKSNAKEQDIHLQKTFGISVQLHAHAQSDAFCRCDNTFRTIHDGLLEKKKKV
eukprot:1160116-Pelagomonas_calceolata.AAC.3